MQSSNGDIRNAVMALQFACVVPLEEKKGGKGKKKGGGGNARAVYVYVWFF